MNYLQKKRLAIMQNRQFKGYLKSVSGVLPLTVSDGIKGNLVNYIIEGNTIQNGTPSVDNPVEIVSVGEKTEKGYKIPVNISHGENAVTTEIYLDEPLCSVRYSSNSYIDYIDYKTELLHKKTKVIILTGDENWNVRTNTSNTFQFSMGVTIFAGFCTHYPSFTSSYIDKQNGIYLLNTGALIITDMRHANLDDFKAYLKEQYEAGTPVTCVVGDKNGTIDPINVDLPKIPIFNGTSIYTAETSIQPSGMTVEYYGKEI